MSAPVPDVADLLLDPLAAWRLVAPMRAPAGVAETVQAAVLRRLRAGKTGRAPGLETSDEELLARAAERDAAAWRALASRCRFLLPWDDAARPDVSGSCCWLAVVHGDAPAHLPLLIRLLRTPTELAPPAMAVLRDLASMLSGAVDPDELARSLGLEPRPAPPPAAPQPPEEGFRTFEPDPGSPLARLLDDEDEDRAAEQRLLVATGELTKEMGLPLRSLVKRGAVAKPWPSPDRIAGALLREFPWAEPVVDRIAADLALGWRMAGRAHRLAPLVLVGAPGTGKSRFASRLADLVAEAGGPPSAGVSMAGMVDNRTLGGTAKGWSTSGPSLPLSVMSRTGAANPILLLDELDKVGGGSVNGSAADTLLTMLEPSTAAAWLDEGTGLTLDLRLLTWMGTANDWSRIPALLRTAPAAARLPRPAALRLRRPAPGLPRRPRPGARRGRARCGPAGPGEGRGRRAAGRVRAREALRAVAGAGGPQGGGSGSRGGDESASALGRLPRTGWTSSAGSLSRVPKQPPFLQQRGE